ncbi:MAG: hypothetical protein ACYC9J_06955 [Sulfuricaulis sp.]
MSNTAVVTLDTPSGPVQYRKLSSRLAAFYNEYPIKEGFRVINRQADTLSYQKGMLQLYEAAVRAGHKPEAVGLPSLKDQTAIVFEATLVGKDGDTIQNATAVKVIEQYKDWEIGETAAYQRLLAKLGFGGEVLDDDETMDMASRGIKVAEQPSARAAPEASSTEGKTTVVPIVRPAEKAPQDTPVVAPESETGNNESSQPGSPKDDAVKKKNENIPRSTLRQIDRLAKMRGTAVPEFKSVQEALEFLIKLQSQGSDSKTASA